MYANGGRLRNEVHTLNHNNTFSNDNYRIKQTPEKAAITKKTYLQKCITKELKSESSALEKLTINKLNNSRL